ncbi:MAG: serine/threonine protein kinase [Pyrinomonadaceae bacterium]|nr:serine/threonine protein kinase [Pyrinomonadaceae bacterium]
MYCPKCKQTFEEGSRRFCPTDGARLISDSIGGQAAAGVFASLLPKIETDSRFDEVLPEVPHFIINEPESEIGQTPLPADDDFFFELDDIDDLKAADAVDEIDLDTLRDIEPAPAKPFEILEPLDLAPRPVARKINPYEIPAGHVNLDIERAVPFSIDFNEEEPEGFVGRIVKGRYKVTEFLGGDESSIAFLAEDKIVEDRKVLVRILLEDPADEIIGSILAEERVSLSHFSHPNIARLIDSGTFTNGKEFLVSEFFDALSIADILNIHGQFSEQRTARVIKQIAGALSEAHQEGILHRDLRPENMILDTADGENEQTILVNFGASNGQPTPQNLPYKSPEILEGRTATIASDVFSLAVVAYEMLTGRLPFSGSTAKVLLRSQNSGYAVLPSEIRHELAPTVDDVLKKAMSYSSADRYTKARDFGDALFAALTEVRATAVAEFPAVQPIRVAAKTRAAVPVAATIAAATAAEPPKPAPAKVTAEPAWKNRSPEPPAEETSRAKIFAVAGILTLLVLLGLGWYYLVNIPERIDVPQQAEHVTDANNATIVSNTEMPPLARTIQQPPNTNFYQNSKSNLRGDLLRNFVGFTMFYPKDWKMNGPQPSNVPTARGKFIDIARLAPDGRMQEQMLVGYYPSKGTFMMDADTFPQLVNETNETLKKILPGYQMVSSGEIKLNGEWRAYEIKFQAGGTSASGEKLIVWGRRLFIPAARPAVRNGFEITMLATSLGEEIRSVDDVGVKGQLAQVLYSFEPSQNF